MPNPQSQGEDVSEEKGVGWACVRQRAAVCDTVWRRDAGNCFSCCWPEGALKQLRRPQSATGIGRGRNCSAGCPVPPLASLYAARPR
eukprot:14124732-Heterocapsa_arctica.AAC.1